MFSKRKAKSVAFLASIFIHSSILAASIYLLAEPKKAKDNTQTKKIVVSLSEYVKRDEPVVKKRVEKKVVEKKVEKKKVIKKKVIEKKKLVEKKKKIVPKKKKIVKKVLPKKNKIVKEHKAEKKVEKEDIKKNEVKEKLVKKEQKVVKKSIDPTLLQKIRLQIQNTLRYPAMARRLKIQGVVTVNFKLNEKSEVVYVSVEKGSGSSLLDSRALDTVESLSGNYPSLSKPVELKIPIAFSLKT